MNPNNRETINHAIGIVEGVACTLENANTRDILFDAVEMLSEVLTEDSKA